MPRYGLLISALLSFALLSACAKSISSHQPVSTEAAPSEPASSNGAEIVRKDLQDYIQSQKGEAPPEQTDVLSWVTHKDLKNIALVKDAASNSEEDNIDPARLSKGSLTLQSKAAITADVIIMMRGKVISLKDVESEKSFEQGSSAVCQISKSVTGSLQPGDFNLSELNTALSGDVNMIDMKWTDRSGNSVFTRCLSRQNLKLGDLRAALHNYFAISLAR